MAWIVFIGVALAANPLWASMERRTLADHIPFEVVQVENSSLYFKKVKVAFFDADSTLRVSRSGSVSANSVDDVSILPCVAPRIAELKKAGFLIAVVSNQGGVAAGVVTDEVASGALQTTLTLIKSRNNSADIHYFDYAGYKNKFRKEKTGMAYLLAEKIRRKLHDEDPNYGGVIIDKKHSFMVGDSLYKASDTKPNEESGIQFSNSDRCFAENYYIRYFDPAHFFGWLNLPQPIKLFKPETGSEQLAQSPEESKAGGSIEVQYCKSLLGYKVYSQAISGGEPTHQWIADYQIREDGGILPAPLFRKKGCKSSQ